MKRALALIVLLGCVGWLLYLEFSRETAPDKLRPASVLMPKQESLREESTDSGPDFVYTSYNVVTGDIIDRTFVDIKALGDGRTAVRWSIENDRYVHEDFYTLDEHFSTLKWRIYVSDENTVYSGYREGDRLVLTGTFQGEPFQKSIELDAKPFFYNPKINLSKFALSDAKKIEFWSLRNDTLTKYPMQAVKKGIEVLDFNGDKVETVKVYYAAKGIGEKFFNRTYYFRTSDGIMLTQDPTDGWTSDLIAENGGTITGQLKSEIRSVN